MATRSDDDSPPSQYTALTAKWGVAALKAFEDHPNQALLVGAVGGLLGFFAAGPYGAAKGLLVGASMSGELLGRGSDAPAGVMPLAAPPALTTEFPAHRPGPPTSPEVPAPALGPTRDPATVVWIRSHHPPKTEHLMADAWFLEVGDEYFGLAPGCEYELGRDDEADIRVHESAHKADTVSRRHALVGVFAGALYISDNGSRNGTWIRGKQLQRGEVYRAHHRTAIHLGKFVLVVRPAVEPVG